MASGPITSWQIDGENVETDFIFLGFKINVDGDHSHEFKRCLLLGRIAMTNLECALKSRDLADKGTYIQSYGFSSNQYGCESWTIKKAEHQGIYLLNSGVGEDS